MKSTRLLWASLIAVTALCIGVFAWLTSYMSHQNEQTVSEVAELCLEQNGTQIQLHFDTAMDLHRTQLETLAAQLADGVTAAGNGTADGRGSGANGSGGTSTTTGANGSSVGTAAVDADLRSTDFASVAIYAPDNTATSTFGQAMTIDDADEFLASARRGEAAITSGRTASGDGLIVLGTTAPDTGTANTAEGAAAPDVVVAGIPTAHIDEELSLDVSATLLYSHIIRADGTFVIHNGTTQADSYFDIIEHNAVSADSDQKATVPAVENALASGQSYSVVLDADQERYNVYFTPLAGTPWYLVSVLPQSIIADPVHNLVNQRFFSTLAGCALVLAAVAVAFALYFRMARRQMKAVEEARREADAANQAKSRFLSSMSHDIRTPMNAIVGLAEVAAEKPDDPALVEDCLRKIRLSSKHLLGLINDVLDMSKIESGKLSLNTEMVSLRETADNIVGIIQPQIKARGLRFDVFIRQISEEVVLCDGVRLSQILLNLLSNALKFTPEGGAVDLTISQTPSPKGDAFVRTRFVVHDTGIGMSEEFQEHIFESFEREDTGQVRHTEGTGLGMAIVKSIVDKMEGTIAIQSAPGCGSTFTIELDLERTEQPDGELVLPAWNLLVVDDDETLCRSTADTLNAMGAHADWTTSGTKAVEMVEAHRNEGTDYQAALIDWQMPSMDGVECARRIRDRIGSGVPILLISAYDWTEVEEEARSAGVDGFISKPLFKSTLYSGLKRVESGFAQQAESPRPEKIDLSGKRVLLAEDQELNWEVARALLSSYGLELEWARNGREAIELFETSAVGYYDAVLMDVQMPVVDGYEATRAIRALERDDARTVPIVAMTANVFAQDVEDSLACGMNAHTSKPIDAKQLARMLADLMDRS